MYRLLLIAIIPIVYTLTFIDLSFIFAQSAYWQQPYADRITNIIGAMYFAQDSWHWPLFYVPSLAFPEGTSIIYTDSLPLLALVAKIIYKLTGQWFNYFGFWIFACFPLVGLFTALAMREGRCKDIVIVACAMLLALSSPALLVRMGHAALMGHFLIVWSLFLYLRFWQVPAIRSLTVQFAIVAVLSVLLQTYFLLMVLPFYFSALLQALINKRIRLRSAVISCAMVFSSIVATGYIAGMIGSGSPKATMVGFGLYSMNLASPFLPPREHLPSFISSLITWDGVGYSMDATGGQYEGYNYLGAGVLLLLVLQIPVLIQLIKNVLKNHLFLCLALLALILLAVSSRAFFGSWLLFDLHINNNLFSYFRTSGRLFWPVYYVLVIALALITYKRFSPAVARTIMIVAAVLQLADTQLFRNNLLKMENAGAAQVVSKEIWNPILAKHQFLEQYPSFQCGGWAGDWPENNSNMELLLLAAKQNLPTNSAYLARTSRNCISERVNGSNVRIKEGGLYIFSKKFPMHELQATNQFQKWCREFKFGYVCSQQLTSIPEVMASREFTIPTKAPVPIYTLGEILRFTTDGNGERFLGRGWYGTESWGTWTMGKQSEITLKMTRPHHDQYIISAYARGFVSSKHPIKTIDVYVNEHKIASWVYKAGEDVARFSAPIAKSMLSRDGVMKIKFVSDRTESPMQAGMSADTKQISLGLIDLSIL